MFFHDSLKDAGKERKEIQKNKVLRAETNKNADIKATTIKKEQSPAASDGEGDVEEDDHIVISDQEVPLDDRSNSPVESDDAKKRYIVF